VLYSTGACIYCFLAKRLLGRHGIPYEEHRMRRSDRMRLAELGGGLSYPQIVFGERVVNGWAELRRIESTGELDRLVREAGG
jgi:glutaredoxin